jgi:hypothetical protein
MGSSLQQLQPPVVEIDDTLHRSLSGVLYTGAVSQSNTRAATGDSYVRRITLARGDR